MLTLDVDRLTRYYGGIGAVLDVSFSVRSGEVLGYLFLALVLAVQIPQSEADAFRLHLVVGPPMLAALIATAAAIVRAWGNRRLPTPWIPDDPLETVPGLVLH